MACHGIIGSVSHVMTHRLMDTLPVLFLCVVMCQLVRRLGLAGTHISSRVLGACLALRITHARHETFTVSTTAVVIL